MLQVEHLQPEAWAIYMAHSFPMFHTYMHFITYLAYIQFPFILISHDNLQTVYK